MYCTHCGKSISKSDIFCGFCGEKVTILNSTLANNNDFAEAINDTDVSKMISDEELLKAFVGENKQDFYIDKWKKGNKQTFNLAALLTSIFWLGYRKMYKLVLWILLIFLIVDAVIYLTGTNGDKLNTFISFGLAGVLAGGGNSFYKKFTENEIEKLKKMYSGEELLEKVRKRGGGSWKGFWITIGLLFAYVFVSFGVETIVMSLSDSDINEVSADVQESINQLNVSHYFPPIGLQRTYIEYGTTGNNMYRNEEVKYEVDPDGSEVIYVKALGGMIIERYDQFEITQHEIRRVFMINALVNKEVNILELTNRKEWETGDGDNSKSYITDVDLTIEVPAGIFTECIEVTNIMEWDSEVRKTITYYAPKVGVIKTVFVNGEEELVYEELHSSTINNFSQNDKLESTEEKEIVKEEGSLKKEHNEDEAKSFEGQYILPESHLREIINADIVDLNNDEINLARNEIFARHGYVFDTDSIQQYFEAQLWYEINWDYSGELTTIESANVNFLKDLEEQKTKNSDADFAYLFEFENQQYSFSFPLTWKGKVHHDFSTFEGEEAIAFKLQNNGTLYQDAIFFLIRIKGDPSDFELSNIGNSYADINKITNLGNSHFYYVYNVGDPTAQLMGNSVDTIVIQEMISEVPLAVQTLLEK